MKLKECSRISVLILLLMMACPGLAQAKWQSFRTTEGLADNHVLSIMEDSSGNLWFGTFLNGVSRYNGVSWKTYTEADGLADNQVRAIVEDNSGNLWFGTAGGGVSRYDGESWITYTIADGLANNTVYAAIKDSSGNLWFGTFWGVSRYDGESWRTYTEADGLASNYVYAILEDSSGNLWFGHGSRWGGVSRYDGVSWRTYTEADGLASNYVYAILEDSSGNLWFACEDGYAGSGVSRYDGVGWRTYTEADGLASNHVNAILEDSSGKLWFGTSGGGASCFDGKSWKTYTEHDGLVDDFVAAIFEDGSGNLWFGSKFHGVSRYDRERRKTYTEADGLVYNSVRAMLEDSSRDLWFGTIRGVSRYDGVGWSTYTEADGLANNWVTTIVEDSSGSLWFGTLGGGVSRYNGESWTTYTTEDGLAGDWLLSLLEDSSGNLWFGTYTYLGRGESVGGGVNRYDGESWTTYTTGDGLAGDYVSAIFEDSSGDLWFGTDWGVSRYDGESWTTYTTEDGLAGDGVYVILEDSSGNLWFGTHGDGISSYDGVSWTTYTVADGLASNNVYAAIEDSSGIMWFGTLGGVSRYDGESWMTYTEYDGLADKRCIAILEDSRRNLWFGSDTRGVTLHEPDRVPPQTVIWPKPPSLTANTTQTIVFVAAFKEEGIAFSYSFDGAPWSEWSSIDFYMAENLSDGEHILQVRARDLVKNTDPTAALCKFEVDATPPAPLILSPYSGEAVGKTVAIEGTADDLRFERFDVEIRSAGAAEWGYLGGGSRAVTDGALASWNTTTHPDGDYEIRLSVSDTLGLTGTALVRVIVDNEAPWAYETTPVLISSENGGDVYTTGREAHLYFPPNAFTTDTEIRIGKLTEEDVPDTLRGGKRRRLPGFEITWNDTVFSKPGTLELTLERLEFDRDEGPGAYLDKSALSIYVFGADSIWRMLGGTLDRDGDYLSAPVAEPGLYAVFDAGALPSGGVALSPLRITPRVFSPVGSFANTQAAIGFTLGRPGPVTVKIYNRAGRLVQEIMSGEQLNAGANLVHWDGRDGDGGLVEDGVYLVAVEALGQKQVKPLAVVR